MIDFTVLLLLTDEVVENVLLKNCINIILIQPINEIFVPQFSYNSNLVVNKISLQFKTMLFTNLSYFIFVV